MGMCILHLNRSLMYALIIEFNGLKSKMYWFIKKDSKGIAKSFVRKINHEVYTSVLFEKEMNKSWNEKNTKKVSSDWNV